jgi:hypothetical protein
MLRTRHISATLYLGVWIDSHGLVNPGNVSRSIIVRSLLWIAQDLVCSIDVLKLSIRTQLISFLDTVRMIK